MQQIITVPIDFVEAWVINVAGATMGEIKPIFVYALPLVVVVVCLTLMIAIPLLRFVYIGMIKLLLLLTLLVGCGQKEKETEYIYVNELKRDQTLYCTNYRFYTECSNEVMMCTYFYDRRNEMRCRMMRED